MRAVILTPKIVGKIASFPCYTINFSPHIFSPHGNIYCVSNAHTHHHTHTHTHRVCILWRVGLKFKALLYCGDKPFDCRNIHFRNAAPI